MKDRAYTLVSVTAYMQQLQVGSLFSQLDFVYFPSDTKLREVYCKKIFILSNICY
jgi:hypothetical protein